MGASCTTRPEQGQRAWGHPVQARCPFPPGAASRRRGGQGRGTGLGTPLCWGPQSAPWRPTAPNLVIKWTDSNILGNQAGDLTVCSRIPPKKQLSRRADALGREGAERKARTAGRQHSVPRAAGAGPRTDEGLGCRTRRPRLGRREKGHSCWGTAGRSQ